jgi:hypothetical protein
VISGNRQFKQVPQLLLLKCVYTNEFRVSELSYETPNDRLLDSRRPRSLVRSMHDKTFTFVYSCLLDGVGLLTTTYAIERLAKRDWTTSTISSDGN